MNTAARIRELDGIRGIAILMVLIWHYITCQLDITAEQNLASSVLQLTTIFRSGVDLFFVLSGFLIGGIILDNHKRPNFLKVFWIRRTCRILPVLVFLLLACFVLKSILDNTRFAWLFDNLMPWWTYATFTQNIAMGLKSAFGGNFLGITWSLAVEEQFYLLAPLLILIMGEKIWIKILLPLVLIAFALRLHFSGFYTFTNFPFRMDALLLGVLVAVTYRKEQLWLDLKAYKHIIFMLFLITFVMTIGLVKLKVSASLVFLSLAIFYSTFLIVALLYSNSRLTKVLRSGTLCFFGSISYGLYMYHQAVSGLLHGWLRNGSVPALQGHFSFMVTSAAFLLSILLAWISYKSFESFFLKLGRKSDYGSIEKTTT